MVAASVSEWNGVMCFDGRSGFIPDRFSCMSGVKPDLPRMQCTGAKPQPNHFTGGRCMPLAGAPALARRATAGRRGHGASDGCFALFSLTAIPSLEGHGSTRWRSRPRDAISPVVAARTQGPALQSETWGIVAARAIGAGHGSRQLVNFDQGDASRAVDAAHLRRVGAGR